MNPHLSSNHPISRLARPPISKATEQFPCTEFTMAEYKLSYESQLVSTNPVITPSKPSLIPLASRTPSTPLTDGKAATQTKTGNPLLSAALPYQS